MMHDMSELKLYAVPASHPCAAVERALELKGIDHRRVDLIPMTHVPLLKLRFGRRTVPAVRFPDGTRLSGSRTIMRELDRRVLRPRLVPDDPHVLDAEEWGEEVLQPLVRRVLWAALKRCTAAMTSYAEGARLPIPTRLAALGSSPVAWMEAAMNRAGDEAVRADLQALPEHVERVASWIDEGTIGGEPPNGADLQIASGMRLLLTLGDLSPLLDGSRAADLARRWFPAYPGATPSGALPAEWITSLR
jgi:glutathione S-transferase